MRHLVLGSFLMATLALTACHKQPKEFQGEVDASSPNPNATLSTPTAGTVKVHGKTYNCSKNNDSVTVRYDESDPNNIKAQVTTGGKTYDLSRKTTDTNGEYVTTATAQPATDQPVKWTHDGGDSGTLTVGSEAAVTYHCVAAS